MIKVIFRGVFKKMEIRRLIKLIKKGLSLKVRVVRGRSIGVDGDRLYHYVVYFYNGFLRKHEEIVLVGHNINSAESGLWFNFNEKHKERLKFVLGKEKRWLQLAQLIKKSRA